MCGNYIWRNSKPVPPYVYSGHNISPYPKSLHPGMSLLSMKSYIQECSSGREREEPGVSPLIPPATNVHDIISVNSKYPSIPKTSMGLGLVPIYIKTVKPFL